MDLSKQTLLSHLELAARIYAAIKLSIYGLGKIVGGQFYQNEIPEAVNSLPISELSGFDLAWTFFGYSFGYILFIGGTQLLGSIMLLFQRTKILGAAILIPVLLNIIVLDYFYEISTGAMLSAISYLLAISFVLVYNRDRVIEAVKSVLVKNEETHPLKQKVTRVVIAFAFLVVLMFLENEMLTLVSR
jgi:hypothetical protein